METRAEVVRGHRGTFATDDDVQVYSVQISMHTLKSYNALQRASRAQ